MPSDSTQQAFNRRRLALLLILLQTLIFLGFLLLPWTIQQLTESEDSQSVLAKGTVTIARLKVNRTESDEDDSEPEHAFLYTTLIWTIFRDFLAMQLLAYTVLVPLLVHSSAFMQRYFLFPRLPSKNRITLSSRSFSATHQFYLPYTDSKGATVRLGVWHIPPQDSDSSSSPIDRSGAGFGPDARLVLLLHHGNAGNRGTGRSTFRTFTGQLGCHLVVFDYRGYADSTNLHPTADGLAEDSHAVYQWILSCAVPPSRILVWGHSLGGAVAMRMVASLPPPTAPLGVVLESTFPRLADVIAHFPFSRPFRLLPYFDLCFLEPYTGNPDLNFDTLSLLPRVHAPLLILHAVDDNVIPYHLSEALYETAVRTQPAAVAHRTVLVDFPSRLKCRHKGIASCAELPKIVSDFVHSLR